ncbi:MAG: bacteriohemerythrin [Limnochordia bacterium]|jgi:hemerythrin
MIVAIEWTSDLAVGVPLIDSQHQELFARINKLLEASNQGRGKEEVGRLVDFLADYVKTHFRDEEELQRNSPYPYYEAHKKLHDGFVASLSDLKGRLDEEGPKLQFVISVNKMVVDWLIQHISKVDKEMVTYLK